MERQDRCTGSERNGQLVFLRNAEILLPENAPVRLISARLEEPDYRELYRAYSPRGRKSKADRVCCPRQWYTDMRVGSAPAASWKRSADIGWTLSGGSKTKRLRAAQHWPAFGTDAHTIESLFCQHVLQLEKQGECDHKTVFIDGTKMERRAGRYTFCWRWV